MQETLSKLPLDRRRIVMRWLTGVGPFWSDGRRHSPDDYWECEGTLVTDTAVGEAGSCVSHGLDHRLVSFAPSTWLVDPLVVSIRQGTGSSTPVPVTNYWEPEVLEQALRAALTPVRSWTELRKRSEDTFLRLQFTDDSFMPLRPCPFSHAAAERILVLLDVLNTLAKCLKPDGQQTLEGRTLYEKHFHGDRAWFSDSSDTEKQKWSSRLTFRHPNRAGEEVLCSWHGKVSSQFLRVHFSWPAEVARGIFVPYIGPKLTKR